MWESGQHSVYVLSLFLMLQSVPIDSCVLWEDSGFLQQVGLFFFVSFLPSLTPHPHPPPPFGQASDITGGIYIKVPEPAGLVQFMLVSSRSGGSDMTAPYSLLL